MNNELLKYVSSDLVSRLLQVFITLLLYRLLKSNELSEYLFSVAISGVCIALSNPLDTTFIRFYSQKNSIASKSNLFISYVFSKLTFFFVFSTIGAIIFSTRRDLIEYHTLFFSITFVFLTYLNQVISRLMIVNNLHSVYRFTEVLNLLQIVFFLFILYLFQEYSNLLSASMAIVIISNAAILVIKYRLTKEKVNIYFPYKNIIRRFSILIVLFKNGRYKYYLPLQISSLSIVAREHLPIILLKFSSLDAAIPGFKIISLFYQNISSLFPSTFDNLRADFLNYKKREFIKNFKKITIYYILFNFIAGLAMLLFMPQILPFWGLSFTVELKILALIFGIDLIFSSLLQIEYQHHLLQKGTFSLLRATIMRQIVIYITVPYLISTVGPMGVAIGLLIGTISAWLSYLFESSHLSLIKYSLTLEILLIAFISVGTYSVLLYNLTPSKFV